MEDVKKDKAPQQKTGKEGGLKQKTGALSDKDLGKVTGGGSHANTEFNPQPDPPGRQQS